MPYQHQIECGGILLIVPELQQPSFQHELSSIAPSLQQHGRLQQPFSAPLLHELPHPPLKARRKEMVVTKLVLKGARKQ